jgi:hypothetical protein
MTSLRLATATGLSLCERTNSEWAETRRTLNDVNITSVIAREGVILAGTNDGVFRSDDVGQTWRAASAGLTIRYVRWLAFHPDLSDCELAGTEPGAIFISHNGGESWRECSEVTALRKSGRWYLPYSPEAGCVRGFAFHGQRAYAAVEVGGVLVSDDAGDSWRLATGSNGRGSLTTPASPLIDSDVHSIDVHPSSPDLVFAPTHAGLYRSNDGGASWTNLYRCYCRAAWIDPTDADHIIFGPADNVDTMARIEETHDGGRTWQVVSAALHTPWPGHMVERFKQVGDELLGVLSNGALVAAPIGSQKWRYILSDVTDVNAISYL